MKRADQEYAMPSATPNASEAAIQVASFVAKVPFGRWRHLVGPVLSLRTGRPSAANKPPEPLHLELDGGAIVLGF
jgi:hypothetical protein